MKSAERCVANLPLMSGREFLAGNTLHASVSASQACRKPRARSAWAKGRLVLSPEPLLPSSLRPCAYSVVLLLTPLSFVIIFTLRCLFASFGKLASFTAVRGHETGFWPIGY